MTHPIPDKALAQHIAVLGKTGSGKSYAIRGVVEQLLDEQARACVIDPTGTWWGLKSSATGKSGGYPVVIFGGTHADLPLSAAHGEALAEAIGTSSTPAILDTSQMKVGERTRFFADFADALVRKNKGPLHLVIDEAHLFAPQGKVNDPQSGAMLHAANNLVSLGRSRGLRIVLITQRPAKLHKDSLTQVETLVAMRLIAPQDRKAVEEWIKDNADQEKGREIISSLATLKTGQAWVWSPELRVLERVTFQRIRTFDSSRAPDDAGDTKGPVLAPIDREAIAARLKTVAVEADANDPKKLRARIAELERQARKASGNETGPDQRKALIEAEQRGYERGRQEGERYRLKDREAEQKDLRGALHRAIETALNEHAPQRYMPVSTPVKTPVSTGAKPGQVPLKSGLSPTHARHMPASSRSPGNGAGEPLPKGEAAILAACIQFPDGLRRDQLTVLTGYKRSTRDAYIQRLGEKGYVEPGDLIRATVEGRQALPDAQPLPTGEDLQTYWFQRLPEGEGKILRVLVERHPHPVQRDELTEVTGYKRSTRDAYLQRLAAKQLVADASRGEVRASEDLF